MGSTNLSLSQMQRKHVFLVAELIIWAHEQGWELTWGETYRPPEQARLNAQEGKGIIHSLHVDRLAVDLNLWIDGEYTGNPEDYKKLGEYWEGLDSDCRWGGKFHTVDADHFSLEYQGRK